ncbi:MAG: DUF5677 domain-containing protein [Bacteroidales bacterium]|nr:DUF5677 domain-containing protein [Bacteroidales bacterium]
MNEIERIRELDDDVFEELKIYFPKISASDFIKKFPTTSILMNMFDTSGTLIKNSIYDNCESDNYYGVKILYRSLIEHYFRFQFIFVNWGLSKSDKFAIDYLEYNTAREVLDLIKAKVTEQQLYQSNFKIDDWDMFLKDHPDFINKSRKEVDIESQKVKFNNIIRFLNEEFNKGNKEMSGFLGELIIDYSNLSSYVHGGMTSYREMISHDNFVKREKEYNRIAGLSFQLSNSIKLFSLIMYVQTDRETFSQHYHNLDKILKQINEN